MSKKTEHDDEKTDEPKLTPEEQKKAAAKKKEEDFCQNYEKTTWTNSWFFRIAVIFTLAGGALGVKSLLKPKPIPYTMSDREKEATEKENQFILKNGGVLAPNNNGTYIVPNAIQARNKDKIRSGKRVTMELEGQSRTFVCDENQPPGECIVKPAEDEKEAGGKGKGKKAKKVHRIQINEDCVARVEEFRRCVNTSLGADIRVLSALRSRGVQKGICEYLRKQHPNATCDGESDDSHLTGQCGALDISARDAVTLDIPYKLDAKGKAVRLDDKKKVKKNEQPDPEEEREIAEALIKANHGLLGLHDLAMECGQKAGFYGGFCGDTGNPWHYGDMDGLPENDPRRTCTRDSDFFKKNQQAFESNPPLASLDDVREYIEKLQNDKTVLGRIKKSVSAAGSKACDAVPVCRNNKGKIQEGISKGWEGAKKFGRWGLDLVFGKDGKK